MTGPFTAQSTGQQRKLNSKQLKKQTKKKRYKLRKKHQAKAARSSASTIPPCTTQRWRWLTTHSCNFTLSQKRQLFKGHYICKTIERNTADIYELQGTITTTLSKDAKGTVTTTQSSTATMNVPETLETIASLQLENQFFNRSLSSVEKNETTKKLNQIKQLQLASANQGYNLRRRINRLKTNLQSFIVHLNHRIRLQPQNTAFLLQAQTNRLRQSLLQQEPSRLKSSNKIHNFTTHELPADFVNLLNKGTNFIPTLDNCHSNSCKKTVTEEVNTTLCQTIRKSSSTTSRIQRRTKTRRIY